VISLETRTELKSIGRHVLAVMLIFSFAAAIFLSLMITVPFMRSIYDEVLALAAEGQAIETDALADKLMVYISENEDLVRKCTYIASALCSLLGALVFLRPLRKAGHTIRSLYQKEAFSWSSLGLAILAAVGISYVSSLVVLVTEWLYNHFGLTVLLPEAVPDNSLAALVYALLIAPFMEEFIFRGGILKLIRPKGERFALMASAICFAAFHGNLHQIPGTFLLGLWLGYLTIKTDSLLLPTLTHIGYNGFATLASLIPEQYASVFTLIMAVGIVGGLWACRKLMHHMGPAPEQTTPPDVRAAFYFSLPMMLFWGFCLFSIVQSIASF